MSYSQANLCVDLFEHSGTKELFARVACVISKGVANRRVAYRN